MLSVLSILLLPKAILTSSANLMSRFRSISLSIVLSGSWDGVTSGYRDTRLTNELVCQHYSHMQQESKWQFSKEDFKAVKECCCSNKTVSAVVTQPEQAKSAVITAIVVQSHHIAGMILFLLDFAF